MKNGVLLTCDHGQVHEESEIDGREFVDGVLPGGDKSRYSSSKFGRAPYPRTRESRLREPTSWSASCTVSVSIDHVDPLPEDAFKLRSHHWPGITGGQGSTPDLRIGELYLCVEETYMKVRNSQERRGKYDEITKIVWCLLYAWLSFVEPPSTPHSEPSGLSDAGAGETQPL